MPTSVLRRAPRPHSRRPFCVLGCPPGPLFPVFQDRPEGEGDAPGEPANRHRTRDAVSHLWRVEEEGTAVAERLRDTRVLMALRGGGKRTGKLDGHWYPSGLSSLPGACDMVITALQARRTPFGSTTRICITLVMAYSEHDLSNLLVRLHVSIRFDDCVERKGLGDFRFEFPGVEAFVDVALGSRESLRSGHDGLRQPVATNSQRLLNSWYERKWRSSHRQPAIFDDHRAESGCLRELAEQRTSDRIENDARTRPTGDVLDARHQVFFVRHDHMVRAECKQCASFGSCAGRCDGNGSLGFHCLNCSDTNAAGSRRDESELSLLHSADLE